MQRQIWKENIKIKENDKDEKKKEKKKNRYDPAAYPFGADELLLETEFKNEER